MSIEPNRDMSISERLNSILAMESKERRVRTSAGESRFGQPINSVITPDVVPKLGSWSNDELSGGWVDSTEPPKYGDKPRYRMTRQTRRGVSHIRHISKRGKRYTLWTRKSGAREYFKESTHPSLESAKAQSAADIGESSVKVSKLHDSLPRGWKPSPALEAVLKKYKIDPATVGSRYNGASTGENGTIERLISESDSMKSESLNGDTGFVDFVSAWTRSSYEAIQNALYTGEYADADTIEGGIDISSTIKKGDAAFKAAPSLGEDVRVARLTRNWPDVKAILRSEPGAVFSSNGYLATTLDDPNNIHGTHGMGEVMFDILIPKGKKVVNATSQSEKEIVINRNAKLVLLTKPRKGVDGTWIVRLLLVS